MDSPGNINKKENQAEFIVQKDVLGQEKPHSNANGSVAHPKRIFIALTIVVVLAILYWVITGR